jgi:hypothetical protein
MGRTFRSRVYRERKACSTALSCVSLRTVSQRQPLAREVGGAEREPGALSEGAELQGTPNGEGADGPGLERGDPVRAGGPAGR